LAEGDGGALGGGGAAEEGVGGCGPEAEGKGPSRYGLDLFVGHPTNRTRFCFGIKKKVKYSGGL
jgi:hypothetical protein